MSVTICQPLTCLTGIILLCSYKPTSGRGLQQARQSFCSTSIRTVLLYCSPLIPFIYLLSFYTGLLSPSLAEITAIHLFLSNSSLILLSIHLFIGFYTSILLPVSTEIIAKHLFLHKFLAMLDKYRFLASTIRIELACFSYRGFKTEY
jgi:hypothetical protein